MKKFKVPDLQDLDGKVVVITGGALGIGAELVRLCYGHGAHVFFGDVLESEGKALAKELSAPVEASRYIQFVKTDVSKYEDNLSLFDAAYITCGRVDHAVAAAGISEKGKIVDPELSLADVRKPPTTIMTSLDINLTAPIYFSRVASAFLRQGPVDDIEETTEDANPAPNGASNDDVAVDDESDDEEVLEHSISHDSATSGLKRPASPPQPELTPEGKRPRGRPRKYPKVDKPKRPIGRPRKSWTESQPPAPRPPPLNITKSLTLVSSVAGFTEAPGLTVYSAAKHGVMGLMRSLRKMLITHTPSQGHKIRTNAVCPWMTKTRMVHGIQDAWAEAGLPTNEPKDVARAIAGAMVDRNLNGAALYVAGGEAVDIEPGLEKTMGEWMGRKWAEQFNLGQTVLGLGDDWQKGKKRMQDLVTARGKDQREGKLSATVGVVEAWKHGDQADPAAVGKFVKGRT